MEENRSDIIHGRFLLMSVIVFLVVICDSLTKTYAIKHVGDHLYQYGDFSLALAANKGAIFGVGASILPPWFFLATTFITLISTIILCIQTTSKIVLVGCSFFVAGAFGNLLDRILRGSELFNGSVIDFIQYKDMFIFNVADVSITFGVALLLCSGFWHLIYKEKVKI